MHFKKVLLGNKNVSRSRWVHKYKMIFWIIVAVGKADILPTPKVFIFFIYSSLSWTNSNQSQKQNIIFLFFITRRIE